MIRTLTVTYNEIAEEIEIADEKVDSGQYRNVISFPSDMTTVDRLTSAIKQVEGDAHTLQMTIIIEDVKE